MSQAIVRTVQNLGLLRPGTDLAGKSPLLDALTAAPRQFQRTVLLFPVPKNAMGGIRKGELDIPREEYALAHRILYLHAYQAVGSVMLAILNVEAARRIRDSVEILEAGYQQYEASPSYKAGFKDSHFEKQVAVARELRDQVDGLIGRLAENADNYELSKELFVCVLRYRNEVIRPFNSNQFINKRDLVKTLPRYGFDMERAYFEGPDKIIAFLETGGFIGPTELPRLNVEIAGVHMRLQPNARNSTTLNPSIPKDIPPQYDVVGLLIEQVPEKKDTGTHFAGFFEALMQGLQNRFEFEVLPPTGSTMVFFPKWVPKTLVNRLPVPVLT